MKSWVKHKSQSYSIQAGLSSSEVPSRAKTKPANCKLDDLVARTVSAAGSPVTTDGLRPRIPKQIKQTNNNVLLLAQLSMLDEERCQLVQIVSKSANNIKKNLFLF